MLSGVTLQFVAGCSPFTFGPNTVDPEPEETPASMPEQPMTPVPISTPIPAPTLPPEPEPTPTPEPFAQVLRVTGATFDGAEQPVRSFPSCLRNGMTTAGLLRMSNELEPEPDWAETWEHLEDREGWRFHIRPNDNGWGEGIPIIAQDFVDRWLSLLSPAAGASEATLLFDVEFAAAYHRDEAPVTEVGIVAVDEWTLDVYLERPRETFPVVVSSMPLRLRMPGSIEVEPDETCFENGGYRSDEINESSIHLVPNRHYWDQSSLLLERIELTALTPALALTEFQQETVDFVQLGVTDVARVRNDASLRNSLVAGSPARTVLLVPNVDVPPFDSPEIRRALSYLIDRRRLEQIGEGRVIPASRLFPSGLFPAFDDAAAGIAAEFDVDAAFEEIESSPYPAPLEWEPFGLDIPSGDGYLDRVARDVSTQFRENLGIQVPIRVHDPEDYSDGLRERRYSLAWFDWTYPYADPAAGYAELFAGWRDASGPISWSHPEYDELLLAADSLLSAQSRAAAYAGCEGLLQEHGASIPLVHPLSFYLVQPWLNGLPRDGRSRLLTGETLGTSFVRGISIGERPE
jgi:oligopeptide transport system substrate-binding protein